MVSIALPAHYRYYLWLKKIVVYLMIDILQKFYKILPIKFHGDIS